VENISYIAKTGKLQLIKITVKWALKHQKMQKIVTFRHTRASKRKL